MEEQKQAEQQWNKIRRERINILKEAPSEENLWQAVMAFQDYPFKTVTGLPFQLMETRSLPDQQEVCC